MENWLVGAPSRRLLHHFHSPPQRRLAIRVQPMAKSHFEYVRAFEANDVCLPNTWIVVRLDGQNFHTFAEKHSFKKPNDLSALRLAAVAAERVLRQHTDSILAYGHKLMTTVVSLFSSTYTFEWPRVMPADQPLLYPPAFDARVVLYPTDRNLRDYLAWRQVDCHINNLYNTCFWKLVGQAGISPAEAESQLKVGCSQDNAGFE
ncbi:unnamed protein product [Protopolystoma xenopodis]|uniref:Probable tRNA(His) guanylyltransferase n=1 Tax=Protopolystoma xenopodis TaxID=117903 RepID=A0A3S5CSQ7_9PLAT|nr:unnamed protein product [Protopolystoma xenopodis]